MSYPPKEIIDRTDSLFPNLPPLVICRILSFSFHNSETFQTLKQMEEFEAYTGNNYCYLEEIMHQIAVDLYSEKIQFKETTWLQFVLETKKYYEVKGNYLRIATSDMYYSDNISEVIYQLIRQNNFIGLKIMTSEFFIGEYVDFIIETSIENHNLEIFNWAYRMNHNIDDRTIISKIISRGDEKMLIDFCDRVKLYPGQYQLNDLYLKTKCDYFFTKETLDWFIDRTDRLVSRQTT